MVNEETNGDNNNGDPTIALSSETYHMLITCVCMEMVISQLRISGHEFKV
jgi:hypothetical protein